MREWSADVVVDEDLVRRLVAQFPELRVDALRLLAEGWDNAVWVVNERWAFRFPRRTIAIPGVERELAVLPRLAPLLAVPIPEPVFFGQPADGYPWPFFGGELLPGREVSEAPLDDDARREIALELAAFLRRLHDIEPIAGLPQDPNRRADMTVRVPKTREQLAEIERLGIWRTPPAAERLLDRAEQLPHTETLALVHGDLHFRHVLVDQERVSGVIDWGDVCCADPAIDLQLLWSFLPPPARTAFLDVYGPVTDEQLLRARVLAFSLSAALARYGHEEGMAAVEREALESLERAASDWSSSHNDARRRGALRGARQGRRESQ